MVYVVNDMNHNYDKAKKFGPLVFVTEGKVPIFKTDVTLKTLGDALSIYTKDDYLLLAGPALLCIMAAAMLLTKFDELKLLVFDAKEQDYVSRHITKASLSYALMK